VPPNRTFGYKGALIWGLIFGILLLVWRWSGLGITLPRLTRESLSNSFQAKVSACPWCTHPTYLLRGHTELPCFTQIHTRFRRIVATPRSWIPPSRGTTEDRGLRLSRLRLRHSGFQINVWESFNRNRSSWLYLALTQPSPGGRGGIGAR
jgi:hypothetical protein